MTKNDWASTITTGAGGVRTEEAGIVTGEIVIRTYWLESSKHALVTVRAAGGGEWYTMTGGPVEATTEEAGHAVHLGAVEAARNGSGATVPPL